MNLHLNRHMLKKYLVVLFMVVMGIFVYQNIIVPYQSEIVEIL